jgi:putative oxidoreductase
MNLERLFATNDSYASLFQRVLLGTVVLAHGAQKLLGWFGGWGFDGTVAWFGDALHVPAPLAVLVILSDFFGSLLLIAGAFTRVAALGTSATMLGAIAMVHAPNGFFMNWSGAQAGEGFEFHILALALSLPLMVNGAGAWAADSALARMLPAWRSRWLELAA